MFEKYSNGYANSTYQLRLAEVEYVGHVVSAEGTSFTEEKRLKVLKFPLPETQKNTATPILQTDASNYGIRGYLLTASPA